MRMKLREKFVLFVLVLTVAAVPAALNVRADHDETRYRASLTGFGEVPPKLVNGSGRFTGRLSEDKTTISWTLSWTGLTGPAQMAHIHFGQTQVNGAVVVFFCGGGGRPACPDVGPEHSGSVSGTWTSADILAVPAQAVTAGDFAGFQRFLRADLGYANIHTTQFAGGEIRGQVSIRGRDHDDDDN